MKEEIAILIRVYDRVEDLKYNIQIIRQTWTHFDYYIIVVSNGYPNGYDINSESINQIDKFVSLSYNAGHKKGNSQLLTEGMKFIPDSCAYTIILEADTWLYTDNLIQKYIKLMEKSPNTVWASADWYDKDYALAVDFAIIKSDFIKNNPKIFDFEEYPESYIANFLRDTNTAYLWIKENMPVHIPSYIRKYPYVNDSSNKRFYVFPKSRMITHHIEFVNGGMASKKRYFNIISGIDFFSDERINRKKWGKIKMEFWTRLTSLFIKKSWFSKKYYRKLSE